MSKNKLPQDYHNLLKHYNVTTTALYKTLIPNNIH